MRPVVSVLTIALVLAGASFAQTTFATITGAVTDPSGASLTGAHVTGKQVESGYIYETQVNDSGIYTLPNLREGAYDVTVTAKGFGDAHLTGVQLAAREVRRLDFKLSIGVITTQIEIDIAGATVVETETGRISQLRTAMELRDLPLNNRGILAFLSLVPGAGQASTVTATYRFNGSRRNQSEFTIDGISNITNNGTQTSPLTSYIESFQQARIDTADNTADAGAVGQVTVISKSGTNSLHGSAFDYYATPVFRARDFFAPQRGPGISHQPGVSIGGPVRLPHTYNGKNRTFFFFSYETSRGSVAQQLLNPTVPLSSWRNGDFSALLSQTIIKDPTTGQPFPGNIIPQSRLNPVAVKIQNLFYPVSNFGSATTLQAQNFREIATHPFDPSSYWTTRIDHRFSDKTFVYGRYTWQRLYNTNYDANLPTIGRVHDVRDTRNAVVSWTQTLSPSMVNELRYGYMFTNEPRWGAQDGQQIVQQLGLQGLTPNQPNLPGIPNITWSGLGLATITQQVWRSPGFYNRNDVAQENFSWFHGKHTVKAGMQFGYYQANDVTASTALYGNMQFSNRFTGFAYSDFLLGIPTTTSRAPAPLDAPFRHAAWDFFVTDEYKVSPTVTLNLGLRYEVHPHWGSGNGLASLFDIQTGQIVVQDGSLSKVSPLLPANYVKVVSASQAGYSGSALISTDWNNFAPRIGLAWRPFDSKIVLRAGFGVFYDIVPSYVNPTGVAVPFTINEPAFTNPAGNPTVILPLVYPAAGAGGPTTVSLPGAFKKDLRIPYTIQYNLTIEREIARTGVRLSYVNTGMRQGEYVYNFNQPLASTTPYVNKQRPFPQYANFNYTTNGASHQYNALDLEVKRRFSSGLLYDFTWTWARDIGDLERDQTPEYSYDLHRERAVWADIPTHRVTGDFIYQLPFGHGKKWLAQSSRWSNLIFGGWQITGLTAMNTGLFLTPQWQGADPANVANSSSATPANVTIRPNILHDPNLPSDKRSIYNWFDVTAFGPPTPGSFGSSAKGVIVGPGSFIIDAGVAKVLNLSEHLHMRLELTGTNVLNHPNWSLPGLTINSLASAGVITSTGGTGGGGLDASGARSLRLGVRMEW